MVPSIYGGFATRYKTHLKLFLSGITNIAARCSLLGLLHRQLGPHVTRLWIINAHSDPGRNKTPAQRVKQYRDFIA